MNTLQAILLGIVQGITEFLPVSSSGHLQIAKELLGVQLDNNIAFDITLHAATVCSTIVVMWRELLRLLKGLFSRHFTPEQSYVLKIVISMIPAGIIGILFSEQLETLFSSLLVVGLMLLLTAALLALAYYYRPSRQRELTYRDALVIGLAQAAATMPGLSRSGTTIATGLLLGNRKDGVAQFSFLMVIPVILGKMLLDILSGNTAATEVAALPLFAGFMAAFIVGALACKFMIEMVKRGRLIYFAYYCVVVGLLSIFSYFFIL
ncbi:MAG: undecaprenyl-diphosphate phosphatase [Alistipes sp.]